MNTELIISDLLASTELLQNVLRQITHAHSEMFIYDEQQNGFVLKKICYAKTDVDKLKNNLDSIIEMTESIKNVIKRLEN